MMSPNSTLINLPSLKFIHNMSEYIDIEVVSSYYIDTTDIDNKYHINYINDVIKESKTTYGYNNNMFNYYAKYLLTSKRLLITSFILRGITVSQVIYDIINAYNNPNELLFITSVNDYTEEVELWSIAIY